VLTKNDFWCPWTATDEADGPPFSQKVAYWRICAVQFAKLTVLTVTAKRRDPGCAGAAFFFAHAFTTAAVLQLGGMDWVAIVAEQRGRK
jgi:hypothetical protein